MMRSLGLAALALAFVPLLSCGGHPDETADEAAPSSLAETSAPYTPAPEVEPAPVLAADSDLALADDDPALPRGTFATLDALCAAQKRAIVPRLAKAHEELADRGVTEPFSPSCKVDAGAMKGVVAIVEGSAQAIAAVTYETGWATETSVVVRTAEGWSAFGDAVVSEYHDDPGCPSIVRDGGLVSVRADGERVTIVDKADRGFGEKSSLVLERARSCTRTSCSEPQTIAARLDEHRLFATTFTVDAATGDVTTRETWSDDMVPVGLVDVGE